MLWNVISATGLLLLIWLVLLPLTYSFSRTSFTLDCVALLLQKYIHDVGTKPLTVIIQPSIEDPYCDRAARTVYLKTT